MPPLPPKKNKREADITPRVLRWFEENWPRSAAIEVKYGKNALLPHQKSALHTVTRGTFTHKMADMGRKLPFDAFLLKDADAIVVACQSTTCTVSVMNTGETFTIRV